MAARVTGTVQPEIATLGEHGGPREVGGRSREAFFASFSRELRWSLGHDGRLVLLEGAWHSMLGWRPKRLHGWHWEEIVHPADRARVSAALEQVRERSDIPWDVEFRFAVATGGYRPTRWTLIGGSDGDGILGLGRVSTEPAVPGPGVRRHPSELEARVDELEQRLAAMLNFAGMAAHQLAEPLIIAESSAILVADELGDEIDASMRARLDAISRGAARARMLMDALLEDARTSAEPPELRSVDVGDVVEETLTTFEPRIEAQRAIVRLGALPTVLADRALLSVVLDNLVANALKHGPRDGAVMSIDAGRGGAGWRISVTSGGPPIPAEDVGRILEPYVRLPGERRISGNGLGLAICVRLIKRLGGTLGVEPGRHEGNTFWFELPGA
jgi:signal transduction histidine kinase